MEDISRDSVKGDSHNAQESLLPSAGQLADQFVEAMRPLKALARQIEEGTQPLKISLSRRIDEILESLVRLSQSLMRVGLRMPIEDYKRRMEVWRMHDQARETGWLLHPRISEFDEYHFILTMAGDPRAPLAECISWFYSENWLKIGLDLKWEFLRYSLDDLSKSTFCAALKFHEEGKYDLVPRILFPEIERVMRIRLFNNCQSTIKSRDMIKKFCNGYSVRKVIGRNPIAHYTLFCELIHWVFASQKERDTAKTHCVPNRHEVVHGLDIALTFKDSVNMLLFASFIMGVMQSEAQNLSPERKDGCYAREPA